MKRLFALAVLLMLTSLGMAQAQTFDQYGGYTGLKGTNTSGFFRVEKINGRYWLVTPDNNVFWSTGVNSIVYYDSWGGYNPQLDYRSGPAGVLAKYPGGQAEWMVTLRERLDEWGMNTLGGWSNLITDVADQRLVLGITGNAKSRGCVMVDDNFADVFDPLFEIAADARSKALSSRKDSPWVIGAFPDNELKWYHSWKYRILPEGYIKLPATAHGKQYWVNTFLKGRYATIADLNAAYGTSYADFDELLDVTEMPDDPGYPARYNDKLDFHEAIAEKYYSTVTSKMRQYDPNHLIFTTRWAMWAEGFATDYDRPFNERVWKVAGKYCDVFANNGYQDFADVERLYQHNTRVVQNSKLPFMVTEHCYNANDSLYRWASWPLDTQMERGWAYADQVKKLLDIEIADDPNDPGHPAKTCMGIHWFAYPDEPALGRPDGEAWNCGLLSVYDEAYLPLVDVMYSTSRQIYDYAANGQSFDLPEPPTAVAPLNTPAQTGEKGSSYERIHNAVDLSHVTGVAVDDPDAAEGKAWSAIVGTHTAGACMVYGPYTPGAELWSDALCTVKYRIKVSDNTSTSNVASIDVLSHLGGYQRAARALKGTDFASADTYQEFSLTFTTPDTVQNSWEYRVIFHGVADVTVDTITVTFDTPSSYVTGSISDSKDNTKWYSAPHDTPDATEWAALSLGSTAVTVDSLRIIPAADGTAGLPVDFELQYSNDGSTWATIPGQSYTNYPYDLRYQDFEFEPVTCKYLRLYATKLGQSANGKYRLVLSGLDVVPKTSDATPTLEWTYDQPVSSYTLLLSPVQTFTEEQTMKIEGITGTSYTPMVPLAQGRWSWTVKAISPNGNAGKYLKTARFEVADLPADQIDPTAALKCEEMPGWKNLDIPEAGWDGSSFAFLDDALKTEGNSSLRVAIMVNSLNKQTNAMNEGVRKIWFGYAGPGLDYSAIDTFTFDFYPKRFGDTTETVVSSSKYINFRMIDAGGNVVADQPLDPAGAMAYNQWHSVSIPLTGRRCQVTRIEFYVDPAADKLTWDERCFFNIDNLTTAPLADMTPPQLLEVKVSGYTVNNIVWASAPASDPETGVSEYFYCVGSTPGADDLVPWTSNGASPNINVQGLSLADGDVCYVSARAVNGIDVSSKVVTSKAIRKVSLASDANAMRQMPIGSWAALEGHVVVACFPGRFYAEKADRSSGIGVVSSDSVEVGDRAAVYGRTQTVDKEVVLEGGAGDPAPGVPIQPVAMNQKASGGEGLGQQAAPVDNAASGETAQGLSNLGCLVRLWGSATYVDPNGAYFYIDDGSGLDDGSGHKGVKVESPNLLQPAQGSFARVTGVMTVGDIDSKCARVLKPRSNSDLVLAKVANYLLNGGFESGSISPWLNVGAAGEVKSGTWYLGTSAHSGSWFFGSYGSYTTRSGVLYQTASVDPGKTYAASCYSGVLHGGNEADDVMNRIGIDPTGGTDPNAASVVWSDWDMQSLWYTMQWRQLSTPSVIVTGDTATIFLQYSQQNNTGYHINCFDDILLSEAD